MLYEGELDAPKHYLSIVMRHVRQLSRLAPQSLLDIFRQRVSHHQRRVRGTP